MEEVTGIWLKKLPSGQRLILVRIGSRQYGLLREDGVIVCEPTGVTWIEELVDPPHLRKIDWPTDLHWLLGRIDRELTPEEERDLKIYFDHVQKLYERR
jgi:hypothetical protein